MSTDFDKKIRELLKTDSRYAPDAYSFVSNAVTFTVSRLPEHRHVNAKELILGLREYAENQFGVLAPEVLESWGISTASDIGNLVYNLISVSILSASPGDQRSDFEIDLSPLPQLNTDILSEKTVLPKID